MLYFKIGLGKNENCSSISFNLSHMTNSRVCVAVLIYKESD